MGRAPEQSRVPVPTELRFETLYIFQEK